MAASGPVEAGAYTRRTDPAVRIPYWLGLCLFTAIALFFLWEEHEAHILGALPWLLVLACPLIHVFMHRGHDHGHGHRAHRPGGDP